MLAGTETLATIANHWFARFEHALASGDRGLLDVGGFFAPLVEFLDRQVKEGFIHPAYRAILMVASTPEALLDAFAAYEPPAEKWTASVRRA